MDIASIGGIALAIIGILAGMMIEGGSIAQITQPTAAMIVIGGTVGAVMLQFPMKIFVAALKQVDDRSSSPSGSDGEAVVDADRQVRQQGAQEAASSLSTRTSPRVEDPFLKQALMLAIDGTEPSEVRKIMQMELDNKIRDGRKDSRRSSRPPADTPPPSASSARSSA